MTITLSSNADLSAKLAYVFANRFDALLQSQSVDRASAPFIPYAAQTLCQAMGQIDPLWTEDLEQALTSCAVGDAFTVPGNLFGKITDEQRDEWSQRFSGTRP